MCGFNHLIFILSERSSISCNIWRVVHSQPLDWHKGNGCVLTDSWSLGRGDRGVIIMPNKCHDTVIRWRVETRRLVRPGKLGCSLLSHYSVPSVSQGCQSELPHTPHTLVSSSLHCDHCVSFCQSRVTHARCFSCWKQDKESIKFMRANNYP